MMTGQNRRRLKHIKKYLSPQIIVELIEQSKFWPYKTQMTFYKTRDRALLSLLYLTEGRINEVLRLTKDQFDMTSEEAFIVIHDFEISKRKPQTIKAEGIPKIDIPLPTVGTFAPLTEMVEDYLRLLAPEQKLFSFKPLRAWQIVTAMTPYWCHWFRCQKLSYLINLFHSDLITAKISGIKAPGTLAHYYKTEWTQHRKELLK